MNIALISFTTDSLSVRLLSSYMKIKQHNVFILFILEEPGRKIVENIINFLKEKKIDLVGISLVTDDFIKAKIITEQIKKRLKTPVIWGGAHPSIKPEECLKFVDMVCVGEGEEAMTELGHSLEIKDENINIKNIYFKKENRIIYNDIRPLNEDLDSFPFQDIDFDNHFVISHKKGVENFEERFFGGQYNIICSRGCPFSCSYCYNNSRRKLYLGKGCYLRERSSDNILLELERVKSRLKSVKIINLWDDNFLNRSEEDLRRFAEKYNKLIKLPFFCLANPYYITEEKIKILKSAGLRRIQIGVQTGSERVNFEIYNRPIKNKTIIDLAILLHKYKIFASYDFIFNNPYETIDDIKKTIDLILKFPKPFKLQGYNLIYYPGSAITDRAIKDGFINVDGQINETSKIQAPDNSPLKSADKNVLSDRFYVINYEVGKKKYYNLLIALIQFYPNIIIKLLLRNNSPCLYFIARFLFIIERISSRARMYFRSLSF